MRPILFHVDAPSSMMTILFPGKPHLVATVPLQPWGDDAIAAARTQLAGFSAQQLAAMREAARPIARTPYGLGT